LDPTIPRCDLYHRSLVFRSYTILLDTCRVLDRLYSLYVERRRRMWTGWTCLCPFHRLFIRLPLSRSMFLRRASKPEGYWEWASGLRSSYRWRRRCKLHLSWRQLSLRCRYTGVSPVILLDPEFSLTIISKPVVMLATRKEVARPSTS